MNKRKFSVAFVLGAALILVSIGMILAFFIRSHVGANRSQEALGQMQSLLPDRTAGVPGMYPNPNMPVLEIDGTDYVALLEIPMLDIALPVSDRWDNDKLYDAPARYYGSVYDHTLVIGGADQSQQFGFCDQIDQGTVILVTDMTGAQFTYTVRCVERSESADGQWLTSPDYDLTLFCRDLYSTEYIAVRCDFAYR